MFCSDFVVQMFLYYVTILQCSFYNQNQHLQNITRNETLRSAEKIKLLADIHYKLGKISLSINKIYSPQLLVNIAEIFFTLTFGCYYTVFILKLAIFHYIKMFLALLSWPILVTLKLVKILWISWESAQEVRKHSFCQRV